VALAFGTMTDVWGKVSATRNQAVKWNVVPTPRVLTIQSSRASFRPAAMRWADPDRCPHVPCVRVSRTVDLRKCFENQLLLFGGMPIQRILDRKVQALLTGALRLGDWRLLEAFGE
jgi:hypothetical protein